MRKSKSYCLILAAALAAGVASPVLPAFAADTKIDSSDEIKAGKLPPAVMQTFEKVIPAGAKKVVYHKQVRGKANVFVARWETPAGQTLKLHANPDGTVYGGAEENPGIDLAALTAAAAPLTPAVTPAPVPAVAAAGDLQTQRAQIAADIDQRGAKVNQVNAKIEQLNARIAELAPTAATNKAAAAERDQDTAELQRQSVERERQVVEIARQEQRIHDIDAKLYPTEMAAAPKLEQEAQDKDAAAGSAPWHYTQIENSAVPPAAYVTMLKYTKGAHGMFYRKEEQAGKVSYSVHYLTPQDKRYWVSVYPEGKVRSEPRLSIYQPDAAAVTASHTTPAAGAAGNVAGTAHPAAEERAPDQKGEMKYEGIQQAGVPAPALKAMEKYTKGNHDLSYRKEMHPDGTLTYSVHYLTPDNKRYWVSIDPKGTLEKGPLLSTSQPEPAKK